MGAGIDNAWFTSDDGLQLQTTSPCKDVGDNSGVFAIDILSNNRIINSTVDMGAYEFNSSSVSVESSVSNDLQISVYPNPASNVINVSYELLNSGDVSIVLVNAIGQVVYAEAVKGKNVGRHTLKIDTDVFATGVYQLTIKTSKKVHVQKVIVMK